MEKKQTGCLPQLGKIYQTVAILLFNTLLLLLVIEGIGSLIIPRLQAKAHQAPAEFHQQVVGDVPWLADYWREHYLVENEYHPYVIWRPAPLQGKTINIDAEGFRATPEANCQPGAYTIFAFGGSTMWGYGVPDWATIPAYLQEKLNTQHNDPVCVRNFAQKAFVSTQGVIELLGQLQQGNVPDVVIFYDGINDVEAAYHYGHVAHLLEDTVAQQVYSQAYGVEWLKSTYTFQLAQVGQRKIGEWTNQPPLNPYAPVVEDLEGLATDVLAAYWANYQAVEGLAEQYGFEFYFIWQPCLTTYTGELLPVQQMLLAGYSTEAAPYFDYFRYAYELAKTADYDQFYYRADALLDMPENVWIDPQHLTPAGNERMAEVILQIIPK